ncbi:hypothetical protein MKW94_022239 [Papaver nudicaule]|uniref:Ribosome biogenesis protein BMS1/TSR1 C-terminal domain-containing protein n=1 Tax=Papaver nudicaule TaxID=74823 RepID=A0AA41S9G8_PAPNU|nr:hypothetical protein [Papaver nudicaule]
MQARLKRHNWHRNLLKSQDVVTVSAGWRRYQTKPIYAGKYYGKYDNGLHQILEYNPEHEHCLAMFWGPCAPPRTRIVVVHGSKEVFRIAAKAVVLDHKHSSKIMKEHRLEGKLHKILDERTALIKFESKYDVTEFEGSPIWTGSGILGTIDKADKSGGIARCTFEKSISKCGTFIMSLPFEVVAPLFFKPCESSVSDNKDSLEKEDPARRRLRRRRVDIIDGEPCSHPDTSYFTWPISDLIMENKRKETVVVMSKEKRVELINKKQREESDKLNRIGLSKTTLYY